MTGKATNFKFCVYIYRLNRNKSPLKILRKVAISVVRDSRKFSGHTYVGRIARSSLRQLSFLVNVTLREVSLISEAVLSAVITRVSNWTVTYVIYVYFAKQGMTWRQRPTERRNKQIVQTKSKHANLFLDTCTTIYLWILVSRLHNITWSVPTNETLLICPENWWSNLPCLTIYIPDT